MLGGARSTARSNASDSAAPRPATGSAADDRVTQDADCVLLPRRPDQAGGDCVQPAGGPAIDSRLSAVAEIQMHAAIYLARYSIA
jgi:hypothetical protein